MLIFEDWPEQLPEGVAMMWGAMDDHRAYTIATDGKTFNASWSPLDRYAICAFPNLKSFDEAVRVLQARANAH